MEKFTATNVNQKEVSEVYDSTLDSDCVSVPPKQRKRRFPTLQEFAAAGEDQIKRKIALIMKWDALKIRDIYLVKRTIDMDVVIDNKKQTSTYAEMEDKKGQIINAWLTNIIKEELANYNIRSETVYIMPLGEAKSKETGHFYQDFIIQTY